MVKYYPVYEINCGPSYSGSSLVAARNVKEANDYIKQFKESDPDNRYDSYGYLLVNHNDKLDHLFSTETGIIKQGIYYTGL